MSLTIHLHIDLLNTIGKLYEAIVKERLLKEQEDKNAFFERQFGFRKEKSAIHAMKCGIDWVKRSRKKWCMMVLLDVKNAFNTAPRIIIITRIRELEVSGYLIEIELGLRTKPVKQSV